MPTTDEVFRDTAAAHVHKVLDQLLHPDAYDIADLLFHQADHAGVWEITSALNGWPQVTWPVEQVTDHLRDLYDKLATTVNQWHAANADPPYPGKAFYYRDHPDYAGEVDHAALIARLSTYDGWALSTSAAALPAVLALCPPGVRVAASDLARGDASWAAEDDAPREALHDASLSGPRDGLTTVDGGGRG
jgi:hypothetical protein